MRRSNPPYSIPSNGLPLPHIAALHDVPEVGERPKVMAEHERVLLGGSCEELASRRVGLSRSMVSAPTLRQESEHSIERFGDGRVPYSLAFQVKHVPAVPHANQLVLDTAALQL